MVIFKCKCGFEYDPVKSKTNWIKHGIDFEEVQSLWEGPVLRLPSKNKNEVRELAIGKIKGIFWTAIITPRQGAIRIISCRRSRDEEKEIYENKINYV